MNGQAAGTFGEIDRLTYSYDPNNPNRLSRVADAALANVGFVYNSGAAAPYAYDDNGNLIKDDNKGITQIQYNYLNLPMYILFNTGNWLKYTYDAQGNKLQKTKFTQNTGVTENRFYSNGVEFKGSDNTTALIDIVPNPEGFTKRNTAGAYEDDWILRDHLGNTRVVFSDKNNDGVIDATTEIVQVNAYYPFGLNHGFNANGASGDYKYQYNGKSLEDDFGLNWNDYGARFYDPALGRWHTIDPLAEISPDNTPYAYVRNNPMGYIDPDGMTDEKPVDGGTLKTVTVTASRLPSGTTGGLKPVSSMNTALPNIPKIASGVGGGGKSSGGGHGASSKLGGGIAYTAGANPQRVDPSSLPTNSSNGSSTDPSSSLETAKLVLAAASFIPGIGSVASVVSAGINMYQGNYGSALLDLAGAIPGLGVGIKVLGSVAMVAKVTASAKAFAPLTKCAAVLGRVASKGNYKAMLTKIVAQPSAFFQAHHVFPQKFLDIFERAGMNIHEGKYMQWWENTDHLKNARGYNNEWKSFFGKTPNPTLQEIEEFGRGLMKEYGITVNF